MAIEKQITYLVGDTKTDFGCYEGVWGWWLNKSVKKGKKVTKILFQVMLNNVLRSCKKIIYVDVKAKVKQ